MNAPPTLTADEQLLYDLFGTPPTPTPVNDDEEVGGGLGACFH
jgi:hypothetical protein